MFDSVLRRETLPKRRFGSGALIGGAVYVAVGAVAVWAARSPREAEHHDVLITFVKHAPPLAPPPPPASAPPRLRPKPRAQTPERPVVSHPIIAPTRIPEQKPPEQEPVADPAAADAGDAPAPVEGGMEGGMVGGVAGGAPGGAVGGVVGGVVDPSAVRMDFDDRMTPPVKLSGPDPQYTDRALEREVEGTMIVRCIVAVDGKVSGCRVLKGLPFMNGAVVDALERRRYKPATFGGRPVEVNYDFKVTLRLR